LPTGNPQAATIGMTAMLVLSPTPPEECLSTAISTTIGKVKHLAGIRHGKGEVGGFERRHAVEQHRHCKSGSLIIWNIPIRKPRTKNSISCADNFLYRVF
jgi:hypothetical protein